MSLGGERFEFLASFGQGQLWYLHELAPQSTAYNIAHAFDIRGELDVDALERAFAALIRRHDSLRTGFRMVDGQLHQIVWSAVPFAIEQTDLGDLCAGEREQRLAAMKHACARRHFDLAQAPLLAAHLARLDEGHHVLLFCIHHIVVDHLSELQIGAELSQLYAACRSGTDGPDRDRLQFPDYAVWQRERLTEAVKAERLEYWRAELEGRHHALDLLSDHPRPRVQSFAGDELPVCLSPELSSALLVHARHGQHSLFVVLLAALSVLLHKYSGHPDVIVGCPMANRPTDELHEVVGLFMNVLPISIGIDPRERFDALTRRVRGQVARTQAVQDTPFEWVVQASRTPRSTSQNPLAQVLLTVQDPPLSLALSGVEVASEPLHNGGAKLDLSLWFWDDGTCVRGLVEYSTDAFSAESARHLFERLEEVLRQCIADPGIEVGQVSLLAAQDRAALSHWCEGAVHADVLPSMHDAFFQRVAQDPERIVLATAAGEWSAAKLAARAEAMAAALRRAGVVPGDIVGVCLERSADLPAALLGVLSCGAAYLPLDPVFPAERISYLLADSGTRHVIVSADTQAMLSGTEVTVLSTEGIPASAVGVAPAPQHPRPDDLAYVMYTSGSTGRPKGVRIPHRAVGNFLASMRECPGIDEHDVVLAVTTYAFDISVLELFLPLSFGAKLWLADRRVAEDAQALMALIDRERVTLLQATPSTWRMLRAGGWTGRAGMKALVGGESLAPELAQWLAPKVGELWNMYGPTETTIWSSCARIHEANADVCPIGRPIWNTMMAVVDDGLQRLPSGVIGEIVIGGSGLALGYHRRPELTAERFVRLPGSGEPVYRTGDYGFRRHDGQLFHLGRRDDQVKVRGYRIELGEIASMLATLPQVDAVTVRDWRRSDADHRLVAYYCTRAGQALPVAALREHARRFLPDYMLPQHFVQLDAMPVLPNGKIDRNALPTPILAGDAGSEVPEHTLTPQERLLLAVWRELIGVEALGLDDNFFEVGGHSLLAVAMASRIEQQTGTRLTILQVATGTLRTLAAEIAMPAVNKVRHAPGVGAVLAHWLRQAVGGRTLRRSEE